MLSIYASAKLQHFFQTNDKKIEKL
jgi:hypothetical protein